MRVVFVPEEEIHLEPRVEVRELGRRTMSLIGRWRIVEMDLWDLEAIDLVGPGFIEFGKDVTGGFGFIAVPGELDARAAPVALAVATIHPSLDGDETEPASVVFAELDEPGTDEIDGLEVPQVHLHDPPSANQAHCSPPRFADLHARLEVDLLLRHEDDAHPPASVRGQQVAELLPGEIMLVDVDDGLTLGPAVADDAAKDVAPGGSAGRCSPSARSGAGPGGSRWRRARIPRAVGPSSRSPRCAAPGSPGPVIRWTSGPSLRCVVQNPGSTCAMTASSLCRLIRTSSTEATCGFFRRIGVDPPTPETTWPVRCAGPGDLARRPEAEKPHRTASPAKPEMDRLRGDDFIQCLDRIKDPRHDRAPSRVPSSSARACIASNEPGSVRSILAAAHRLRAAGCGGPSAPGCRDPDARPILRPLRPHCPDRSPPIRCRSSSPDTESAAVGPQEAAGKLAEIVLAEDRGLDDPGDEPRGASVPAPIRGQEQGGGERARRPVFVMTAEQLNGLPVVRGGPTGMRDEDPPELLGTAGSP